MKGRSHTKADKARFAALHELGCVVCRVFMRVYTPPEVHHINGKTAPGAHQRTLPLCYRHHREGVDCVTHTSRHPHKERFEKRYATEEELLEMTNVLLEKMAEGRSACL